MPIKPHAYASQFPGVDHLPSRLPRLDRYGHAWCLVCHCRNGRAVAGDGVCDQCRTHHPARYGHGLYPSQHPAARDALARQLAATDHGTPPAPAYPRSCQCGQLAIGHQDTCDACRAAAREPQGSQPHLFTPTAAPIPGQLQL